jgi:Ca2+-binding RTX toxin-like protein
MTGFVIPSGPQRTLSDLDLAMLADLGVGTKNSDILRGTAAAENMAAGAGDDIVTAGGGNDLVDGGAGIDAACFSGPRSQYVVSAKGGQTIVRDMTAGRDGVDTLTNVEFLRFSDRTVTAPASLNPIGLAIADQLFVVYLGRGVSADWRNGTAAEVANGASGAILGAFFSAAVADRAFDAGDSTQAVVNKTFHNIFGVSASQFEQNAWAGTVSEGYVTKESLPWAMFNSYLGATNVPDAYKIPAQNRIVAANAFTNLVNGPSDALLGGAGAAKAESARAWLLPIRTQSDAAVKVASATATVAGLSGTAIAAGMLEPTAATETVGLVGIGDSAFSGFATI